MASGFCVKINNKPFPNKPLFFNELTEFLNKVVNNYHFDVVRGLI